MMVMSADDDGEGNRDDVNYDGGHDVTVLTLLLMLVIVTMVAW